jgi:flavodoxin
MKTLIIYTSQTGNTKKMAEAVYDAIIGAKTISPVSEAPDPADYDLVMLGFYLMAGKPDPKSSEYLAKLNDAKVFLFATHGAAAGSDHAAKAMAHAKSLAPSADVVGTFSCPGEVNPAFLEKALKKDPPPPWIDDAPKAVGHPDPYDINQLVETIKATLPEYTAQP